MEIDQHLGGIGHTMRLRQFRDVLLCDFQNLILQWQIKCSRDDQPCTRHVCPSDIDNLRQLVYRIIDKMRREDVSYYYIGQETRLIGLVNCVSPFLNYNISLP